MPARSAPIPIDGFMRTPSTSPNARLSDLFKWSSTKSETEPVERTFVRELLLALQRSSRVSRPEGKSLRIRRETQRAGKEAAIGLCIADIDDADIDQRACEDRLKSPAREKRKKEKRGRLISTKNKTIG